METKSTDYLRWHFLDIKRERQEEKTSKRTEKERGKWNDRDDRLIDE